MIRPSIQILLTALVPAGVLALVGFSPAGLGSLPTVEPNPGTGRGGTVLVELFTSEGCSSCPPADRLLLELERAHRVGDAEVIVLGEHVDYWDRLGWADPYASAGFSDRQARYAARFGLTGPYTPQVVIDGQAEAVGSDRSHVLQAIAQAAGRAKATVTLAPAPAGTVASDGRIGIAVRIEGLSNQPANDPAEVFLAVTEGGLQSQVLRGENAGLRLDHAAVVRRLSSLGGSSPGQRVFAAVPRLTLGSGWKRENLHVVVFAQGTGSGRVLGAASLALTAEPKGLAP